MSRSYVVIVNDQVKFRARDLGAAFAFAAASRGEIYLKSKYQVSPLLEQKRASKLRLQKTA